VLEIERAGGDFSQIHPLVSGKQQEIAWSTGDKDAGMVTFGMCGGLIHDVPTCQDLVNTIMVDAEEIVKSRLTSML
jgi:nitronate monooxygenase